MLPDAVLSIFSEVRLPVYDPSKESIFTQVVDLRRFIDGPAARLELDIKVVVFDSEHFRVPQEALINSEIIQKAACLQLRCQSVYRWRELNKAFARRI